MSVPFPSPAGVPITGQAVPGVKAAREASAAALNRETPAADDSRRVDRLRADARFARRKQQSPKMLHGRAKIVHSGRLLLGL
jgi:hypothetical protein